MRNFLAMAAGLLLAIFGAAAQSISVNVHNVVAIDEQFNVVFTIDGKESIKNFNWSPGENFRLVWGPQKGYSRIINGTQRTESHSYTYILIPTAEGSFTIPAATAEIGGKTVSSGEIHINVVSNGSSSANGASSGSGASSSNNSSSQSSAQSSSKSSTQTSSQSSSDDLFLRLTLSKNKIVVGEPITATLKIYSRVSIQGFENASFPSFNSFWSQEIEAPQKIEFQREQLGDRIYESAVLRRWNLIPQKSGKLEIDPAELVCLETVRNNRSSGSLFDEFFSSGYTTVRRRIFSKPIKVEVSPLPSGAPASFNGAVGKFSVKATLSKDNLNVHEAASLNVAISGNGNLSLVDAPEVRFPGDFEVYDTKMTSRMNKAGTSGEKAFEYPFIPRSHGDFVLPPVKFTYYNTTSGKYETALSDSIRVSVNRDPNAAVSSNAPVSTLSVPSGKGVRNISQDIRHIKTARPKFRSNSVAFATTPLFWILAAVMVLAALIIFLLLRGLAAKKADVVGSKSRKATKNALKRLALAGTFLKQNLYTAFYEELHKSLLGFVSDKLNMDMAEQNKENISAALISRGVPEGVASDFNSLIEVCEEARYSPSSSGDAMKQHYEKATAVISAIDSMTKGSSTRKKGASSTMMGLLVVAMLLPSAFCEIYAQEEAPVSISQDVDYWTEGVNAYSEGRWDDAVAAWSAVDEVYTAELWYNLGNAWYKSGYPAKAVLCYERALKLDPSDKDAAYNLSIVRAGLYDRIDSVPEFFLTTWMRSFASIFNADTWAILSLICLAAFLGLVLLFFLGKSSASRKWGFFGGIVALLLFILTLSFSLSLASKAISSDEAVVMSAVAPVKSSPSEELAKDLFILHEGTKVVLIDEVSRWTRIELSDGRQGWIKSSDIEKI